MRIDSAPNIRPVVTYSNFGDSLWIAWILDNSNTTYTGTNIHKGIYPIALKLDRDGIPSLDSNYLVVPRYTAASDDTTTAISLAGRNSSDNLFSFYKQDSTDVYTKTVVQTAWQLRTMTENSEQIEDHFSFMNLSSLMNYLELQNLDLTLRIFDISGKEVHHSIKVPNELSAEMRNSMDRLSPGIYVFNLFSSDGSINIKRKILAIN